MIVDPVPVARMVLVAILLTLPSASASSGGSAKPAECARAIAADIPFHAMRLVGVVQQGNIRKGVADGPREPFDEIVKPGYARH